MHPHPRTREARMCMADLCCLAKTMGVPEWQRLATEHTRARSAWRMASPMVRMMAFLWTSGGTVEGRWMVQAQQIPQRPWPRPQASFAEAQSEPVQQQQQSRPQSPRHTRWRRPQGRSLRRRWQRAVRTLRVERESVHGRAAAASLAAHPVRFHTRKVKLAGGLAEAAAAPKHLCQQRQNLRRVLRPRSSWRWSSPKARRLRTFGRLWQRAWTDRS